MNAKVTSLNKFRKARARAEDKARADANAARHGQSKATKAAQKAQRDKIARDLENHKRDDDEAR